MLSEPSGYFLQAEERKRRSSTETSEVDHIHRSICWHARLSLWLSLALLLPSFILFVHEALSGGRRVWWGEPAQGWCSR